MLCRRSHYLNQVGDAFSARTRGPSCLNNEDGDALLQGQEGLLV